MSYDMSIGLEDFNYTYNVSEMWYAAIPETGIRTHYRMAGKEALEPLQKIYCYMINHAEDLKNMEPENGWGNFEEALDFVHSLIAASLRNPDETWEGD